MLGEISFAGKVGYNIKTDDAKQRILDQLQDGFSFKVIQKHHERYHDGLIHKLNANPHLVSLRTNGNPYLLFLTKVNFVNQCVFVDKKIQQGYFYPRMIVSRFRFDDRLFEGGTVLDGEMIKTNDGKWLFLLGDIIGYKGAHLENVNLVKRMNLLYDVLSKMFTATPCDVCVLQVKRYFTYPELEETLTNFMPSLPYTCRGITFKPLFLKFKEILYNFDDSLIVKVMRKKYKSVSNFLLSEHVQDGDAAPPFAPSDAASSVSSFSVSSAESSEGAKVFVVKKSSLPDVYDMVDPSDNSTHMACVPTLETSKFLRRVFADKNVNDKVSLLCKQSERFSERWIPIEVA